MPKNPEHTKADSQHVNYFKGEQASHEPLDEVDAEAMFLPEGGIVIYARFADDNGQNITEIRIDEHGQKTGRIDDVSIGEEQIVKLGQLLGVDLSEPFNPDELEVAADSPLIESLDRYAREAAAAGQTAA